MIRFVLNDEEDGAAGDTVTVRGYIRGEWFVNVIDLEDCLPIAP